MEIVPEFLADDERDGIGFPRGIVRDPGGPLLPPDDGEHITGSRGTADDLAVGCVDWVTKVSRLPNYDLKVCSRET
jgi:hypothetical protein